VRIYYIFPAAIVHFRLSRVSFGNCYKLPHIWTSNSQHSKTNKWLERRVDSSQWDWDSDSAWDWYGNHPRVVTGFHWWWMRPSSFCKRIRSNQDWGLRTPTSTPTLPNVISLQLSDFHPRASRMLWSMMTSPSEHLHRHLHSILLIMMLIRFCGSIRKEDLLQHMAKWSQGDYAEQIIALWIFWRSTFG